MVTTQGRIQNTINAQFEQAQQTIAQAKQGLADARQAIKERQQEIIRARREAQDFRVPQRTINEQFRRGLAGTLGAEKQVRSTRRIRGQALQEVSAQQQIVEEARARAQEQEQKISQAERDLAQARRDAEEQLRQELARGNVEEVGGFIGDVPSTGAQIQARRERRDARKFDNFTPASSGALTTGSIQLPAKQEIDTSLRDRLGSFFRRGINKPNQQDITNQKFVNFVKSGINKGDQKKISDTETRADFLVDTQQALLTQQFKGIPENKLLSLSENPEQTGVILKTSTDEGNTFVFDPTKEQERQALQNARTQFVNLPAGEKARLIGGDVVVGGGKLVTGGVDFLFRGFGGRAKDELVFNPGGAFGGNQPLFGEDTEFGKIERKPTDIVQGAILVAPLAVGGVQGVRNIGTGVKLAGRGRRASGVLTGIGQTAKDFAPFRTKIDPGDIEDIIIAGQRRALDTKPFISERITIKSPRESITFEGGFKTEPSGGRETFGSVTAGKGSSFVGKGNIRTEIPPFDFIPGQQITRGLSETKPFEFFGVGRPSTGDTGFGIGVGGVPFISRTGSTGSFLGSPGVRATGRTASDIGAIPSEVEGFIQTPSGIERFDAFGITSRSGNRRQTISAEGLTGGTTALTRERVITLSGETKDRGFTSLGRGGTGRTRPRDIPGISEAGTSQIQVQKPTTARSLPSRPTTSTTILPRTSTTRAELVPKSLLRTEIIPRTRTAVSSASFLGLAQRGTAKQVDRQSVVPVIAQPSAQTQRQRQVTVTAPALTTITTTTPTTTRPIPGVFGSPRPRPGGGILLPPPRVPSIRRSRRRGQRSRAGISGFTPSLTGNIRFNVLGETISKKQRRQIVGLPGIRGVTR